MRPGSKFNGLVSRWLGVMTTRTVGSTSGNWGQQCQTTPIRCWETNCMPSCASSRCSPLSGRRRRFAFVSTFFFLSFTAGEREGTRLALATKTGGANCPRTVDTMRVPVCWIVKIAQLSPEFRYFPTISPLASRTVPISSDKICLETGWREDTPSRKIWPRARINLLAERHYSDSLVSQSNDFSNSS